MESDIQDCRNTINQMINYLAESMEQLNKFHWVISQNLSKYEVQSKSYMKILKSAKSAPSYSQPSIYKSQVLFNAFEKILSVLELAEQNTSLEFTKHKISLTEDYDPAIAHYLLNTKKKLTSLLQLFENELVEGHKMYKKAADNYTNARKATEDANNLKIKESEDALLMYVVSVQEKNKENLKLAVKQEEIAEKQMNEKQADFNLRISSCNREIEHSQGSFAEAFCHSIKILHKIFVNSFQIFFPPPQPKIKEAINSLATFEKELKIVDDFKLKVIEAHPNLSNI